MKIHYVIAIHFIRWLTNFSDFRFKWTVTSGIRIRLIVTAGDFQKCKLDVKKNGKNATETYGMLQTVLDHLAWIEHRFLSSIREVLREFRKRFLGKRPALFKSGQWHFYQDNAPVHNCSLVIDYLTKMDIKTVPHRPYSPDLTPCDIWLFPKLRGSRYETIEETKEAMTKVIVTLTQEDFHGTFQTLLEW